VSDLIDLIRESGKISFGTDGKALTPDAAASKPAKHKGKDLYVVTLPLSQHSTLVALQLTCLHGPAFAFARHLESGYEKTRLYLKEVREDKNKTVGMPSAVDLKSSSNLRREVKKPRKVWPSFIITHEHKEDVDERSTRLHLSLSLSSSFLYRRASSTRGAS
jgi:hypothetical protein